MKMQSCGTQFQCIHLQKLLLLLRFSKHWGRGVWKDYKKPKRSRTLLWGILCLLVISETTFILSHQYDNSNMSWTSMTKLNMPNWMGKCHEVSMLSKKLWPTEEIWEWERWSFLEDSIPTGCPCQKVSPENIKHNTGTLYVLHMLYLAIYMYIQEKWKKKMSWIWGRCGSHIWEEFGGVEEEEGRNLIIKL